MRAVLRPVVFFAAIVFLPSVSMVAIGHSKCTCRLCLRTWQVNYFFTRGRRKEKNPIRKTDEEDPINVQRM
jgi:hypothetical protein